MMMDPVSIVAAALAAGAGAGAKDVASAAVKDAYAGLKALVLGRVEGVPGGAVAVEQHATDPDTWQAPVAKVLAQSGAADDPEVLHLAQQLLALVKIDAPTLNITASGTRSVAAQTITGNVSTGDTHPEATGSKADTGTGTAECAHR